MWHLLCLLSTLAWGCHTPEAIRVCVRALPSETGGVKEVVCTYPYPYGLMSRPHTE